jgi:hypothetical protein
MAKAGKSRWRKQNREKHNASNRLSYRKHREQILERQRNDEGRKEYDRIRSRQKYLEQYDKVREYRRRYYEKHRELIKAKVAARRDQDRELHNQKQREYQCRSRRRTMEAEFAMLALTLSSSSNPCEDAPCGS